MGSLDLATIGNCMIAALIDRNARIVWNCFPRIDGDPVFCALLGGSRSDEDGGYFEIELIGQKNCVQSYLENTAVLISTVSDDQGNSIQITDFAPRFRRFSRMFRPPTLIRRVTALSGRPSIRVRLRPIFDWGSRKPKLARGSNHLRFEGSMQTLRLTTDASVSYVMEERPFLVDRPLSFFFGADEGIQAGLDATAREFLDHTIDFWRDWVRALSIPFEWQDAVIRAAITLKLCNFEETGAIVAALTTSIPEAPGTQRNWDYRYCWLRDAYFVVHALNRLGATRLMEDYLHFIADLAHEAQSEGLQPLYGITRSAELSERIASELSGYRDMGPVRVGNAAYQQVQNDVYGSVILASTHLFFDRRLIAPAKQTLFEQLEKFANIAARIFDQPDAGPWELRTMSSVHTFASVMCWAGCDRLAKIAAAMGRPDSASHWRSEADRLRAVIADRAWNPTRNSYVATFGGTDLDATLLLLSDLGFVSPHDPRFIATVDAIGSDLRRGDMLLRYLTHDDFGHMSSAFLVCAFWYVDALNAIGRRDEARGLFVRVLSLRNSFGLFSEDVDFKTGELWGNFPQSYSMVGLINSAVRLSRNWEEAF
jgi:GH15 family glucan-1,4-alpha-glucosidase